ncbi:MAG: hypothetical protein QM840_10655, partial [Verrucomicrobiota bacterium]|nr:hypothetical protein [Verrucomicrobiota bacterium]
MKTIHHLLLFAGLTAGVCVAGAAPAPDETPTNAPPAALADTKAAPASPQPAAPASPAENAGAPAAGTNGV